MGSLGNTVQLGRQVYHQVRPSTYPSISEERSYLSTNDLATDGFNHFALYFPLADDKKKTTGDLLKTGLSKTLSQCRSLCGTVQQDENGNSYISSEKESTVAFVEHWLDERPGLFPSYEELEASDFRNGRAGDPEQLTLPGMRFRCNNSLWQPEAHPAMFAVQLNYIRGGIVLVIHWLHMGLDLGGFVSALNQYADNTRSLVLGTPVPDLGPECFDRSPLNPRRPVSETKGAEGSPTADADADADADAAASKPGPRQAVQPISVCLMHMTKSKADQLKKLARPSAAGAWVSSHDALVALWWRITTKYRAAAYGADGSSPAGFVELVSVRGKLDPPLPARFFGNAFIPAASDARPRQLTLADVAGETGVPLGDVAAYIRAVTESVDAGYIEAMLARMERGRKTGGKPGRGGAKKAVAAAVPPLKTGDWRSLNFYQADFGFGKPTGGRHLTGTMPIPSLILYPQKPSLSEGLEDVLEFDVPIETSQLDAFLEDPRIAEWFTYRGLANM